MYRFGQEETENIGEVVRSGKLFRYGEGCRCAEFERRWGAYLGVEHATLTSSGTTALTAALVGLGIGPGDEVLIPAATYMASAVAVLAAGAIPVIVDIDETITIGPKAIEAAIGPRTRAIMPVHMWGLCCDMNPIVDIAERQGLLVVEDAAQAAGVEYRGRKVGSIGHAGGFSFNYFKHITCGEGGAVVTRDQRVIDRANCIVDCCNFYWNERPADFEPFVASGSRASEFEGAILLAQLDRLDDMLTAMRREKRRILKATTDVGLRPIRTIDPDGEAGSHVMYTFDSPKQADRFAELTHGTVAAKTGRHVYTNWDPILAHEVGHHPRMNPFHFAENAECRKEYTEEMCAASLDLLSRTVFLTTHPDHSDGEIDELVERLRSAADVVLARA